MASSTRHFKTRDDLKKAKELEEARKAGTAEPEVDEHGNDINPHIPQYISRVPWYYTDPSKPTLKHQRPLRNDLGKKKPIDNLGTWYARGEQVEDPRGQHRQAKEPTKFRKGACDNCGAMTHKTRDCLDRPRKIGAKFSGKDFKRDEKIVQVNLDFEGKRDRWNGYDPKDYKDVISLHSKLEQQRRQLRQESLDKNIQTSVLKGESGSGDPGHDEQDEFKQDDGAGIIQEKDQGTRATIRNLRIREDTAKYLRNLDIDSAYYDPKTRSMRADPLPHIDPQDKDYAGDNFVRATGDVQKLASMELHALRAAEQQKDLPHLQAEPTMYEVLYKGFQEKKEKVEDKRKQAVIEKYGGTQYMEVPEVVVLEQSEAYVEYGRDGKPKTKSSNKLVQSKYPEDEYPGNHSSVWGSYYEDGKWGFACCHQFVRNSYCTGEEGKQAQALSRNRQTNLDNATEKKKTGTSQTPDPASTNNHNYTDNHKDTGAERERKIAQAIKQQNEAEANVEYDDRKRQYNSKSRRSEVDSFTITEEDMEAYKRRKLHKDDPMAKYLSK